MLYTFTEGVRNGVKQTFSLPPFKQKYLFKVDYEKNALCQHALNKDHQCTNFPEILKGPICGGN